MQPNMKHKSYILEALSAHSRRMQGSDIDTEVHPARLRQKTTACSASLRVCVCVLCVLCVGVWVCGCVGVWVCGCVGVWVCGCVGVWVCG